MLSKKKKDTKARQASSAFVGWASMWITWHAGIAVHFPRRHDYSERPRWKIGGVKCINDSCVNHSSMIGLAENGFKLVAKFHTVPLTGQET